MRTVIYTCFCFYIISLALVDPHRCWANNEVELEALSIRQGLESQMTLRWALANERLVYGSEYFDSKQKYAKKAGRDLKEFMDKAAVAVFNPVNKNIFVLFYNLAKAPSCRREYLIQRVRISKAFFDDRGSQYRQKNEYLVEVMKTKRGVMKRADEHYRSYSLNEANKRSVVVDLEIGCGVIPNIAEGYAWPYDRGRLYELVQNYSKSPGYYEKIVFDFSTKYSFNVEFAEDGIEFLKWPHFIK